MNVFDQELASRGRVKTCSQQLSHVFSIVIWPLIRIVAEYHLRSLQHLCDICTAPQGSRNRKLAAMAEIDIGCNLAGLQLSCCILAPCAASQKQHINILVGDVGRMSGICMFLLVVNPSRTSVGFSHLTCTLSTLSIRSKTKQTFLARIYFKHIQTFVKLWLLLRTTSKISVLKNASGPRTNTEKQLLDIASSSSGAVCSKSSFSAAAVLSKSRKVSMIFVASIHISPKKVFLEHPSDSSMNHRSCHHAYFSHFPPQLSSRCDTWRTEWKWSATLHRDSAWRQDCRRWPQREDEKRRLFRCYGASVSFHSEWISLNIK